jgi:ABC-type sugar transport system ATPase subunit
MLQGMSLAVKNLSHAYAHEKYVLDAISLNIDDGELVVLVGRSGCGKSTLLHCIAGLITPLSGSIEIDGSDVLCKKPHKRGVGIMMQDQPLYEHLSVEKNIAFPLLARGEKKPNVSQILAQLQLTNIAKQIVSTCSGGERRRVALGRAIILKPRVLLLDEPLVSLDEELRTSLQEFIKQVHDETGASTLLVTHDLNEAKAIADRVIVL